MPQITRRDFVKTTAAAAAALQLPAALRSLAMPAPAPAGSVPRDVELHWLEGVPMTLNGAT